MFSLNPCGKMKVGNVAFKITGLKNASFVFLISLRLEWTDRFQNPSPSVNGNWETVVVDTFEILP